MLEVVKAFERACGRKLALEFAPRRPGDIAASYADASLASRALGWKASLGIDDMCRDIWRWQSSNPGGY
ncbi:UDP-glucose 4-epimerase [compost metagenome]